MPCAAALATLGEIRGQGLILGVELVEDRATQAPSPRHAARVAYKNRCFELGVVLVYTGTEGNVVELTPPLTLTSEQAQVAIGIIERALDDVASGRFDDGKLGGYAGW